MVFFGLKSNIIKQVELRQTLRMGILIHKTQKMYEELWKKMISELSPTMMASREN